jgi:hypothetical protein
VLLLEMNWQMPTPSSLLPLLLRRWAVVPKRPLLLLLLLRVQVASPAPRMAAHAAMARLREATCTSSTISSARCFAGTGM